MSRRANILGRLRRLKNGAARYVVAAFALAYLSVAVAPCATAASQPAGDHAPAAHAHHAQGADLGHGSHGTAHDVPAPAPDHGDHSCPHCPAGAGEGHAADRSSCFALEDLTNVAASHAKDALQALAPSVGPAAFMLPPPLASPTPPQPRAAAMPPVPLNVRYCVFLI